MARVNPGGDVLSLLVAYQAARVEHQQVAALARKIGTDAQQHVDLGAIV
jgi:hypothetical protein